MATVFISYARADRALATRIADALEAAGVTVWWDHDISTGERWDKVIKRELDAASCVVVLWTPTSVDPDRTVASEWVANEATEGKARQILAPVLMGGGAPPFEFQRIQALDLNHWTGATSDPNWQALLTRIDQLAGAAPPHPDPAPVQPVTPVRHVPPVQPPTGVALLRIERESRLSCSFSKFSVLLDGHRIGELANGGTLETTIFPGPHSLKMKFLAGESPVVEFVAHPSETVFFVCGISKMSDIKGFLLNEIALERR